MKDSTPPRVEILADWVRWTLSPTQAWIAILAIAMAVVVPVLSSVARATGYGFLSQPTLVATVQASSRKMHVGDTKESSLPLTSSMIEESEPAVGDSAARLSTAPGNPLASPAILDHSSEVV